MNYAKAMKWFAYHNPDSRRSAAGFPDLVLVRPPHVLFVELKTEKGRVSDQQEQLIEMLKACNQEVHVWRPRDLQTIHERLALAHPSKGNI